MALPEEFLQHSRRRDLRLGCRQVFPTNRLVHFLAMDGNMAGRRDTDFNTAAADTENGNFNFVADYQTFSGFSREYQHTILHESK